MLLLLLSSFSFSIKLFPYRKSAKLPDVFLLCKVYYVCPLSGPFLAQSNRVWKKKKKKKKTGWKRMYEPIPPLYSYHLPPPPHHHHRNSLPKCFHHLYSISWIVAPTPSFFSSSSSVILSILFFLLSFARPRSSYYNLPTVQTVNRQDKKCGPKCKNGTIEAYPRPRKIRTIRRGKKSKRRHRHDRCCDASTAVRPQWRGRNGNGSGALWAVFCRSRPCVRRSLVCSQREFS